MPQSPGKKKNALSVVKHVYDGVDLHDSIVLYVHLFALVSIRLAAIAVLERGGQHHIDGREE